jgi:hypothetical protein
MIVWSVEYKRGRSEAVHREWFASEQLADRWMHSPLVMKEYRGVLGPNKHYIEGKGGLLSFLQTYAR